MKITTIILDLDGCLTDGKQRIELYGNKVFKTFHARDRQTIRRLLNAGYRVIVVSADDWAGAKFWAEGIVAENGASAEFIYTRKKHELPVDWSSALGVSDDVEDTPFLDRCAIAFCPADADERVRMYYKNLPVNGGQAIVEHIEAHLDALSITQNDADAVHHRAAVAAKSPEPNVY